MPKGGSRESAFSDTNLARIENGIDRLLHLAGKQSDGLSREVDVAAAQKRLQEEDYVVPGQDKSTVEPISALKSPGSLKSLRSTLSGTTLPSTKPFCPSLTEDSSSKESLPNTDRNNEEKISSKDSNSNMAKWYFGQLSPKKIAESGLKMKHGQPVVSKKPPKIPRLPVDVPRPGSPDPLQSTRSNSNGNKKNKKKKNLPERSSCVENIPRLPSSQSDVLPTTGRSHGSPRFSLLRPAVALDDRYLGTFDVPMKIVEDGQERMVTGKAVLSRRRDSKKWLVVNLEVVDRDGSKLLTIQTQLFGEQTKEIVINGQSVK